MLKVPKGTRDLDPFQMAVRKDVISKLTACFERYGAVTIETPVFERTEVLTGKYGEESKKLIYDLADQGGELCSLRYDLTVPFARYLALNDLRKLKRYQIAKVYRRDNPAVTRGKFREFTQCDFDIAGPSEGMLADAEVLRVLRDCIDSLELGIQYTIKLNNRAILDGILEVSGVTAEQVRTISSSIDKLDKLPWESVREEMVKKGLTEVVADEVGTYVVIRGEPRKVLQQILSNAPLCANARVKAGLAEMDQLFKVLDAFKVLPYVSFDLGLARGLDYYTGIIFEVVMNASSEESSDTRVGSIAAGGRYDNLVSMFGGKGVPVVGLSIGIERIFSIVEARYREKSTVRTNQAVVLVATSGEESEVQEQRLAVCSDLWDAKIPCEFVPMIQTDLQKQLTYAYSQDIPFVIIIRKSELVNGTVFLRDQKKKSQVSVALNTLVADVTRLCMPASK